jgi:phosphohistidine phosphatase
MRHAQSAGKQSTQRDYDRLLTPQGEAEARATGKKFSEHNNFPDLILCSAAARTRQTLSLFNETLSLPAEKIIFREDLYDALIEHLLDTINELSDDINKVMIIGHNPGLSLLASDLAVNFVDLGTAQLVGIEFKDETWKELKGPGKEIMNIKQPKF